MGNSNDMLERMHIYDYFTKKWYEESHDDKKLLTWNEHRKAHVWNPELCLKHYIKKELKLKDKKLNICSGKLRERFFARVPFWYSIYGTDRTGYECNDDIVNHEVLSKLKHFTPYQVFKDSPWHAVNVLEDIALWDHPHRMTDLYGRDPIDTKLHLENISTKKGFFQKILQTIDEKSIREQ